jgi:hypothetical protein
MTTNSNVAQKAARRKLNSLSNGFLYKIPAAGFFSATRPGWGFVTWIKILD